MTVNTWRSGVRSAMHAAGQLSGTGFIQASMSKIQGLLKTILQFSRTKSLGKILI